MRAQARAPFSSPCEAVTAEVAVDSITAKIPQSSISISKAARRATGESLQQEQESTY